MVSYQFKYRAIMLGIGLAFWLAYVFGVEFNGDICASIFITGSFLVSKD